MRENKNIFKGIVNAILFVGYIIILGFGLIYYTLYVLGCFITRSQNRYSSATGFAKAVKDIVFSNNPADPDEEFVQQRRVKNKRKQMDRVQPKAKIEKIKKIREPRPKVVRQKSYFFRRRLALMGMFFLNRETREERRLEIMQKYPKRAGSARAYSANAYAPKVKNGRLLRISLAICGGCIILFVGILAYTQGLSAGIEAFGPAPTQGLFQQVAEVSQTDADVNIAPSEVSMENANNINVSEGAESVSDTTQAQETQGASDTDDPESTDDGVSITTEENVIREGDTNPEVNKIQERLMGLHYMDSNEITDYYGQKSALGVELFQRQHELSVDGVVGSVTLAILYSENAETYSVSQGNKGTDIKYMQKRLKELGYLSSGFDANGYFDSDTTQAVKTFQRRNDLSSDGVIGYYTKQELYSSGAVVARSGDAADSGSSSSEPDIPSGQTGGSYSSSMGKRIAEVGQSYLNRGIPYVWGGKTPEGFDCSGFVYYVLNEAGIATGYRTSANWATSSYPTVSSKDDLRPGDICVFSGHVGIYIGNGYMVDSSNSTMGIKTTNITSKYYTSNWVCGKRVAK